MIVDLLTVNRLDKTVMTKLGCTVHMKSYVKLGCSIEEEGCTNEEPGGKSTYIGIREAREITKKLSGG
jgi:hypothetical protein